MQVATVEVQVEVQMSKLQMFALGALGGFLPILASLVTVDLAPIIDHLSGLSIGVYVGYSIRVLALILLGGLMALLNSEVQQPLTLVQLGIAAPALITSYINASVPTPSRVALSTFSIVSTARAEELNSENSVRLAGFFSDLASGLTQPLRGIINRDRENAATPSLPVPPSSAPVYPNTPSENITTGAFCTTPTGRFGPGPMKQLGSPCQVDAESGPIVGVVSP
jgi:hypothetical protein